MSTDWSGVQKDLDQVIEFSKELEANAQDTNSAMTNANSVPDESAAHSKLRHEVMPLLKKVHQEYCALFCDAYEDSDLQKAEKLRKLLQQMLVTIRD